MTNIPLPTNWSFHPYRPFLFDRGGIFITRLVPCGDGFRVQWMTEDAASVRIFVRKRGTGASASSYADAGEFAGGIAEIHGLDGGCDYEFYLASGALASRTRLVRTGDYPGVPVNYLHPEDDYYRFSGRFLCSPTIVRQADGSLLASMDLFEDRGPQNLTLIYRSDDDGATWELTCELFPCFWGKLFVHRGETYMVACSTEHGDILIGKSIDGGYSFTAPTAIFRGSCHMAGAGPDMSPEPPIEYNGRLWLNFHWGSWVIGMHHPCLASIPADGDLLDAASWTVTPPCIYNPAWEGTAKGQSQGTLEGTFEVLPDGKLCMLARYQIPKCEPNHGLAILYRVNTDDPAAPLAFDRVIPFSGNHSKFTVQQDAATGMYYTIVSRIKDNPGQRNLLSLLRSPDGVTWELVTDIFDYTDHDAKKVGFQYVDFFIEGDDLVYLCRTALNGADNFHNSNYAMFNRVMGFREL